MIEILLLGLLVFGGLLLLIALPLMLLGMVMKLLFGLILLWTEKISWREIVTGARQFKRLGAEIERPTAATTVESMP